MRQVTANPNVSMQDIDDTMNLAKARVFHYQQQGWTMFSKDELLSAAYEGISEAIIRFDPNKGSVKQTKFSSYAYFWIEKYIMEYITNNKSTLSGTAAEKWSGRLPYAESIEALDDRQSNRMGQDHYAWLGFTDQRYSIDSKEAIEGMKNLFTKLFKELEPQERLCMQLSIGIGTISGAPMRVTEIARMTRMKTIEVTEILQVAMSKLQASSKKYERDYAEIK
jgi:RNA polymerase sigma factor (sigma-70 family)